MLNGWLKVHRKMLDHWVSEEPELFAMWMRLLLEANHSDKKTMFNGALVEIQRGQTLFGLEAFEAKSGISRKKLRRYLDMLEKDGMIGRQRTNKYSVISIVNYDMYQDEGSQMAGQGQAKGNQRAGKKTPISPESENYGQANGRQEAADVGTSEEGVSKSGQAKGKPRASRGQHLKNVKNVKNVNNTNTGAAAIDYSSWPAMPTEQVFKDWLASRRKAKATHSQTAMNQIGKELRKAAEMGISVDECLAEAATRGWRGFKAEWLSNGKYQQNGRAGVPQFTPDNDDTSWAEGFDPWESDFKDL